MPTCKNCHREISKFDSDVCPYCGTPHPIDADYKTKDITGFVDPVTGAYKLYKSKSRRTAAFLCLFLGWAGIHYFYLGFHKKGVAAALITLLGVGGIGAVLFLTQADFKNPLAFFTPFIVDFVVYAVWSVRYFTRDSLVDANGEFLR